MVVEPKSGTVYTASLATNQIAAVNPETEQVEITTVPGNPHALMQFAISPDGKTLAVSGELSAKVLLFDVTDHMKPKLIAEIPVEHQPFDPIFTPDGTYVVLANKAANAVTLIDPKQHKVAAVITGEGLAQPHGTVISADGKFAYVSNNNLKGTSEHDMHQMVGGSQGAPASPAGPGKVVVIDLAARKIARVIDVGHNAAGLSLVAQ
jgi:YVTN family beta-propeller protein